LRRDAKENGGIMSANCKSAGNEIARILYDKSGRVQCPDCKRTYKYIDTWMKHYFVKHA